MMRKGKITVTLDQPVIDALDELQETLTEMAREEFTDAEIEEQRLFSPMGYSRSSAVQVALLYYMKKTGVKVKWPGRTALDLASGESVPIPDGAEVMEEKP